ncbi:NUDIX hydrolase [Anopheles sinensis]|uniref:NUDIX hydrolase n=1 Tax=Anopheles sinensis TaxID=74873 RepID=A0A084VEA6_ANOSI|nr:NUDIX hydrolase [Anopheles sinensis]
MASHEKALVRRFEWDDEEPTRPAHLKENSIYLDSPAIMVVVVVVVSDFPPDRSSNRTKEQLMDVGHECRRFGGRYRENMCF